MAAAPRRTAIVLFRLSDLRVLDHEPLTRAHASYASVLHVFIFDPLVFRARSRLLSLPRFGPHRARFLLESLAALRRALRSRGTDLTVRSGAPEALLPELAASAKASTVLVHSEVCTEERNSDARVRAALDARGVAFESIWGGQTLYHRDDLPMKTAALPAVFTEWRKATERAATIRAPLPAPPVFAPQPPGIDSGELPSAAELGAGDIEPLLAALPAGSAAPPGGVMPVASFTFVGGEDAAWARVRDWVHGPARALATYKETRNGMLGSDFSSRLSPWLATGCISARSIASEVRRFEGVHGGNDSSYWLLFELMWRDYMRFYAMRHGPRLFAEWGPRGPPPGAGTAWESHPARVRAWALGATGWPLVDAAMRELLATGWMSNRGRQCVASFLVKDLKCDWRHGAEIFETLLCDSDAASNWGNWTYVAGVGADPREDRYFLIPKQSKTYDPYGDYSKHWLPELSRAPIHALHNPRLLSEATAGYPAPIVSLMAEEQEGGGGDSRGRGGGGRGGGGNGGRGGGGGGRGGGRGGGGGGARGGSGGGGGRGGGGGGGHGGSHGGRGHGGASVRGGV